MGGCLSVEMVFNCASFMDDDDYYDDDDDDINVQCIGPCQLARPTISIVLALGIDRKQGLICFPLCSGLLSFPTELYM